MANDLARIVVLPAGDEDGQGAASRQPHRIELRSTNGRVLLVSPRIYNTRFHALRAVDSVVDAAKQVLHHDALGVTWPNQPPKVSVLDRDGKEIVE